MSPAAQRQEGSSIRGGERQEEMDLSFGPLRQEGEDRCGWSLNPSAAPTSVRRRSILARCRPPIPTSRTHSILTWLLHAIPFPA
ncbi:hypothetical protein U9M48_011247 [Paspalum notatum var. saurae]|uniref:Uncharacterized protein n=1 Tax=Paspalum notatum var. saurae TaxID=547442 RepID=A0AAQ3SWI6_PASNO